MLRRFCVPVTDAGLAQGCTQYLRRWRYVISRAAARRLFTPFVLVAAIAALPSALAADVLYVYDDLGRVVQVVAPSGDNAQYSYDAAGNITGITKNTATTVAIARVSPNIGPVGTTVTIYGSGFDTTPANNTVTFNGTGATVSAATANKLTVTVPGGATTGTIGVSDSNGSATSASSFTVGTPSAQAPTVTSFTPSLGTAGTSVTVSGTNFQTTAQNNRLTFGGWTGVISSASSTSIGTTVANASASGKISVTTPYGVGTSSNDFYAVPTNAGTNASNVEYTGRLTVGGGTNTATTTANGKRALFIFDGTQNQFVSLSLTSGTFAGALTTYIYSPDGTLLTYRGTSNSDRFDFIGALGAHSYSGLQLTGTHSILMVPGGTDKGSITAQLKTPASGVLTIGSTTTATLASGQMGAYTVTANAGSMLQVEVSSVTLAGATKISLVTPDGQLMSTGNFTTAGGYIPGIALPASGIYTVLIQPAGTNSGNAGITVGATDLVASNVSVGTITANQNGSYSFPVTYTVTNNGTTPAHANWSDFCYLSADGTLDTSDASLGSYFRTSNLAAGAYYTNTPTCTTSTTTAAGSYTLFMKTDGSSSSGKYAAGGVVAESNETNNAASVSLTLPALPDLAISNVSVGTITHNGNGSYSFPVTYTVTNNGGLTAQPNWYDRCYLSSDGTLDTTDPNIGTYTRSVTLTPTSSYNNTFTCTTSTTTAAGTYTLFMKTDGNSSSGKYAAGGVVTESDETNNVGSVSVTLP